MKLRLLNRNKEEEVIEVDGIREIEKVVASRSRLKTARVDGLYIKMIMDVSKPNFLGGEKDSRLYEVIANIHHDNHGSLLTSVVNVHVGYLEEEIGEPGGKP